MVGGNSDDCDAAASISSMTVMRWKITISCDGDRGDRLDKQ